MLYAILAILMFGLLIAVHEFGHFIIAKLSGVRVHEFAIGMGPLLWKHEGEETQYSLRLFPIGGFCAMEGEDEESDDPGALGNQSVWKQILILVAGAGMNFLAGLLIILLLFSQTGGFIAPVITGFMEGADHLEEAGLRVGDRFHSIDGHRIYLNGDTSLFLNRAGETVDLEILRDGELIVLEDFDFSHKVPSTNEAGETVYMRGIYFGQVEAATPWLVLKNTWYQAIDYVRMVWLSLGDLIGGQAGLKDMSGVIGIVGTMTETGQQAEATGGVGAGIWSVMYFVSFVAVNLAVMNLLPIPALDGGRIFGLLLTSVYTLVRGRKPNPKYEGYIHTVGFVLLLALMAVVAFNDVFRILR